MRWTLNLINTKLFNALSPCETECMRPLVCAKNITSSLTYAGGWLESDLMSMPLTHRIEIQTISVEIVYDLTNRLCCQYYNASAKIGPNNRTKLFNWIVSSKASLSLSMENIQVCFSRKFQNKHLFEYEEQEIHPFATAQCCRRCDACVENQAIKRYFHQANCLH